MDRLAELTLKRAKESIGVHEETPNWGKWVSVYLKFVGIFEPAPWCCAFVSYKVHQAGKELRIKPKIPKTASCQALYNWGKKQKLLSDTPEPGTIFLQWHGELGRYAHTGFVADVDLMKNEFFSIEGNSNNTGSREGKEVCSNNRPVVPGKYKFLRIG